MTKFHMSREAHATHAACMQACQDCIVACQKLQKATVSDMPNKLAAYNEADKKIKDCIEACKKVIASSTEHLEKCTEQPCIDAYKKCIESANQCIKDCGEMRLCSIGTEDQCLSACQACIQGCDECYESCQEMMQLMAG